MNIFTLIDTLLVDYASPRARRAIHAVVTIVLAMLTIWLAADGDWREFAASLIATLYAAANKANTDVVEPIDAFAPTETDELDGLSYQEAGGVTYPENDPEPDADLVPDPDTLYVPGEVSGNDDRL